MPVALFKIINLLILTNFTNLQICKLSQHDIYHVEVFKPIKLPRDILAFSHGL